MAYLCHYRPRHEVDRFARVSRIITRGFACTTRELSIELETVCHAERGTLSFEYISPEAVPTWRDHYKHLGQIVRVGTKDLTDA